MLLGLAGVALVVGVESVHSTKEFLGALAMVGAAFFYGLSSFVVKGRYGKLAAVQTSWISVTIAGLITLPIGDRHDARAHADARRDRRGASRSACVGTAIAFVVYYELINGIGPARAALVSYLAPGVALVLRRHLPRRGDHRRGDRRAGADPGRRGHRLAAQAGAGQVPAPAARARKRPVRHGVLASRRVDLTLSPAEEEFRDTLRSWIADNHPGASPTATRSPSPSAANGSASSTTAAGPA